MAEKEDVQKKILFVILIVIIFVSIIGTLTIIQVIDNNLKPRISQEGNIQPNTASGALVSVEILHKKEAKRGRY